MTRIPAREELLNLLHESDPYVEFEASAFEKDLQGWNGHHDLFDKVIAHLSPKFAIEVGSWKGQSAINIAQKMKERDPKSFLLCIDTWLGNVEHWDMARSDSIHTSLRRRHGYPNLYFQFLANVMHCGLRDNILPFPQTSSIAARWLALRGIVTDFVYLDASHEYADVKSDIMNFWGLLTSAGIMIGDDFTFPGVQKAVVEFSQENGVSLIVRQPKWALAKNAHQLSALGANGSGDN